MVVRRSPEYKKTSLWRPEPIAYLIKEIIWKAEIAVQHAEKFDATLQHQSAVRTREILAEIMHWAKATRGEIQARRYPDRKPTYCTYSLREAKKIAKGERHPGRNPKRKKDRKTFLSE